MAFEGADGIAGEIRVGGRLAARLTAWTLRPVAGGQWAIRGQVADINSLFLTPERPVEVRLAAGKRFWRWNRCAFTLDGIIATITATGEWETL